MIELFHPGVVSLTPAQPHTIAEINHEISSLAILLSSAESRRVFSICTKYWYWLTTLLSLPSKNVWCTCFASLKAVFWVKTCLQQSVQIQRLVSVLTGISLVAGYDMILSNKGITKALIC